MTDPVLSVPPRPNRVPDGAQRHPVPPSLPRRGGREDGTQYGSRTTRHPVPRVQPVGCRPTPQQEEHNDASRR